MLRFFRQLRKDQLMSDKARKYILYAIGEILLVVIGILIALQVNNWNEERKLDAVSLSTIESLQQELIETDVLIDQYIKDTNSQNELTDRYLDGDLQLPADSILVTTIFKLANYIPLRLELPVTFKELGSDRSIIGNNELIERLRAIDAQNQRMKQTLLYLDEIWTDRVVPYYLETQFMFVASNYFRNEMLDRQKSLEVFNDAEFKNLASLVYTGRATFVDQVTPMKDAIQDALEYIENNN